MTKSLPIGVFDSGVGGLSVVRELQKQLPNEDILYLGDTARVPYGSKSRESVLRYARQSADHLIGRGIKLLVIACNTVASVGTSELQALYPDVPVVGVIDPGAEAAVKCSQNNEIAVVATESTIAGGAYEQAIHRLNSQVSVTGKACSLFVSLAEEGWTEGSLVEAILARYLNPLFNDPDHHPDTLVLGCTHYPVLKQAISNVVGPHIRLVDSASTTATHVQQLLVKQSLNAASNHNGELRCLVTDSPERFARVSALFLGQEMALSNVQLVDLA